MAVRGVCAGAEGLSGRLRVCEGASTSGAAGCDSRLQQTRELIAISMRVSISTVDSERITL